MTAGGVLAMLGAALAAVPKLSPGATPPDQAAAAAPPGDVFASFAAFSLFHLVTAGTLTLCMVVAIWLGVRWRGRPEELKLRKSLGYFTLAFQAWNVIFYALPANLDYAESLPLHICDLAGWIAAIAILTQRRWFRIMLFYWGIGLSTQAFFTPVVEEGLGHWKFWLFWIGHAQIIGLAFYDLIVLKFRPTWRTLWIATASTMVYVIGILLPFNIATGFNYAYVGNKLPEKRTILNELGPWPGRVFIMVGIVFTVFFVITAGFPAWSWKKRRVTDAEQARPRGE